VSKLTGCDTGSKAAFNHSAAESCLSANFPISDIPGRSAPDRSDLAVFLRRYSAGRLFRISQAKALSLENSRSAASGETGKRLGRAAEPRGHCIQTIEIARFIEIRH
jgi:hypothetical protein